MDIKKKTDTVTFCLKCGAELVCGAVNGSETCWCYALPNVMPLTKVASGCYCKTCLEAIVKAKTGC